MPTKLDSLYPLQKKDAPRAAAVLAAAFQYDPVWKAVLGDGKPEQRRAAFEAPVRYCLKYGEVYAPSPALEGVAAWLPGAVADMTPWRMLLSGAMWPGMRMGMDAARKMMPIFAPIEADRKAMMRGKEFIYVLVIGVDPRFQGQGFGGRLLRALFEKSERDRVPIYLETETEDNVRLYEHLGFHVVKEVVLPVVHLPMWEMVRDISPSAR
jgi:ribosomal protein S18 acetylase RimI-like enzyme